MSQPTTKLAERLVEMERTQAWLGRQLNVSRQTAHNWIHGREIVTDARQAQIALTLGVKASEFFDDAGYAI